MPQRRLAEGLRPAPAPVAPAHAEAAVPPTLVPIPAGPLGAQALLALQRSAGNHAVGTVLARARGARTVARAWKPDPAVRGGFIDEEAKPATKYNPASFAYVGPKYGSTGRDPAVTLDAAQAAELTAEINLHRAWAMNAPVEHGGLLEDTNVRRTAHGSTRPSAMTYHHIISRNMLWGFWDKVLKNGEQAYLSSMVDAIIERGYASLLGGTAKEDTGGQPILKGGIKTAMGGLEEGRAAITAAERDAMELFTRMYQWMPGNIMHGPDSSLRTDDASSGFEENALAIVGKNHFNLLKATYDNMAAYRTMTAGKARTNALKKIAAQYIQVSGRTDIFPFNEAEWVHDTKTRKWKVRTT